MIITNQERSVDPHSSFQSQNVNKLTRVITTGNDIIRSSTHLLPTFNSSTEFDVSSGVFVKDDVMIQVTSTQTLDITDPTNFVEGSIPSGSFPQTGYIVISYQYVNTPIAPEAELLVLKNTGSFDTDLFIFLGTVTFSSSNVISSIGLEDSPVVRPILNLGGVFEVEILPGDYIGNVATVSHYLGARPNVQIIRESTGEVLLPLDIIHASDKNSFDIYFDELEPNPHVIVTY